jgi:hypothetical protein
MEIKIILPGLSRFIASLPTFTKKENLLFNYWEVLKACGMNWKYIALTLQMLPYFRKGLMMIEFFSYWQVSV